jgi:hypothetical protein
VRISTLVLLAAVLQVERADLVFGVAIAESGRSSCVARPRPVAAGMAITLIDPDVPQRRLPARIGQPLPSCEPLERAQISGPYYRIDQLTPPEESSGVFIAVPSATATGLQVRWCASSEGLHLTIWSGQPLESRRLWHAYYYLGYDVEPSCKDAEVSD